MRGPIDYIIVGFDGANFTGNILKELQKAEESGVISVLALAVVAKDAEGTVTTVGLTEDTLEISKTFRLDDSLITEDDVTEVGDLLENDTAAGLLIVEHLWAKGLKQAILDAGGQLLADGRIHPDASEELEEKEDA
jgi:hypothetical protein